MDIFLGLDLGTTNCKVVAIDTGGRPIASANAPTPAHNSPDGKTVEYDAEMLWAICVRLIGQVLDQLKTGQQVAGMAVASMGESGVLVDRSGAPLHLIPTWHDHRTVSWTEWWKTQLPETDIYNITGLPLDYIYSVNKILWLREHNPQAFSRAHSWLCVADWITYCLTGESTTSYSMASRTMLFDIHQHTWSASLADIAGIPLGLLPTTMPSANLAGKVSQTAARVTGLRAGTPIFSGGHDHICAAVAAGAIEPGIVLDSAGTAEAIMITLESPLSGEKMAASGICCGCHTVKDRYYLIGGLMGGGVLAWVSRLLSGDDSAQALNRLMEEAATSPPGANGVTFLPYLDGSGPPTRDPTPWGAWVDLSLKHTRADIARATVEGLSFGIRNLIETAQAWSGVTIGELRCVGGGTRNAFWQQIKADIIGLPVDAPLVTDVTAQGAALLAAIGAGVFHDAAEAAQAAYRSGVRYESRPDQCAYYNTAYQQIFKMRYQEIQPK